MDCAGPCGDTGWGRDKEERGTRGNSQEAQKYREQVIKMVGLYRERQSAPWTGTFRVGDRVCQPGGSSGSRE